MTSVRRKLAHATPPTRRTPIAKRPLLRAVRSERNLPVYYELRELIVNGRLSPGARVIERDLVELLNVSRTPVRTALHRLQQEGYVVARHRGARQRLIATPLTLEDATELLEMVGALEGIALRRVALLKSAVRQLIVDRLRRLNNTLGSIAS